jgi:p-hydroxybenzoate 3-monooxygenase
VQAFREGHLRTQIVIVGGGPAGMFLAHLLHRAGIDSVVLERRSRDYVEGRVRAGVLDRITVEVMGRLGLDARLRREGLAHAGTTLMFDGETFHIDFQALTRSHVTIYGQSEVMKDVFDAADERGLNIVFEADDVQLHDVETERPFVTYRKDGAALRIDCGFIAGCDGAHGISHSAIPQETLKVFERTYPFGWLGVLAEVPPVHHELIYCNHENGFALASMRSTHRSRCYLQCDMDDRLEDWPDDRFWDEFARRLGASAGAHVTRGASFEKSIVPLRSFVAEPMRHGRLFLLGDAAHIVPPTGAKGMNLAVSDAVMLSEALEEATRNGSQTALNAYSARALTRVWKAERFAWWLTGLTHRFPGNGPIDRRLQRAEFDYLRDSQAAQTAFAENYVGLPLA